MCIFMAYPAWGKRGCSRRGPASGLAAASPVASEHGEARITALRARRGRIMTRSMDLDEIGQVKAEVAYQSAYMLSNGLGKTRMSANAVLRQSYEWRVFFVHG